ncbi:MAG: prepilin-type N-terminal cleavage/methylation domain-containing protein [Thermodesulfobacteriota bacterium]
MPGSPCPGPCRRGGFTLLEVLVAMLLVAMIAAMVYSVLNVSIGFADKGQDAILAMDREYAFLDLVQGQVNAAWLDDKERRIRLEEHDGMIMLVTRRPFLYPEAGVVLALYLVDQEAGVVWYLEKRDFYNIDYDQDYRPDADALIPLYRPGQALEMTVPEDDEEQAPSLIVAFADREYTFRPRCGGALHQARPPRP